MNHGDDRWLLFSDGNPARRGENRTAGSKWPAGSVSRPGFTQIGNHADTREEPIMPQSESSELESQPPVTDDDNRSGSTDPLTPEEVIDSTGSEGFIDPSSNEGMIDPSGQDIPTEPLPEPPVRITIIPGRETDEDVDPGEEVPNIEVEVSTEPR
jgi:hypothetical protein